MTKTAEPELWRASRFLAGILAITWFAMVTYGLLFADARLDRLGTWFGSIVIATLTACVPWEAARILTPGNWAQALNCSRAMLFVRGCLVGLLALPLGAATAWAGARIAKAIEDSFGSLTTGFLIGAMVGLALGGMLATWLISRRSLARPWGKQRRV